MTRERYLIGHGHVSNGDDQNSAQRRVLDGADCERLADFTTVLTLTITSVPRMPRRSVVAAIPRRTPHRCRAGGPRRRAGWRPAGTSYPSPRPLAKAGFVTLATATLAKDLANA